jgi:NADP-dependent 3-hydroxy acid dehydrogenase YdfG
VARRRDRLEALAAEIDQAGGTALVVEADITDRPQAEATVQQTSSGSDGWTPWSTTPA